MARAMPPHSFRQLVGEQIFDVELVAYLHGTAVSRLLQVLKFNSRLLYLRESASPIEHEAEYTLRRQEERVWLRRLRLARGAAVLGRPLPQHWRGSQAILEDKALEEEGEEEDLEEEERRLREAWWQEQGGNQLSRKWSKWFPLSSKWKIASTGAQGIESNTRVVR